MSGGNINSVFYAESYHPIQAGSIDGTDTLPHDNAVYRALLCSNAGLYDPHGDPKVTGDPYCTLFVGRLSHLTGEDTLHKAMSKYGRVKNLRLARHIVTGASRRYAFVEFETEREIRRAFQDAHHSIIDDSEIIVDYNREQLMLGWLPRRYPEVARKMRGVQLNSSPDIVKWKLTLHGDYTIASSYNVCRHKASRVPWYRLVWQGNVPRRYCFFMWLLVQNRLKTKQS